MSIIVFSTAPSFGSKKQESFHRTIEVKKLTNATTYLNLTTEDNMISKMMKYVFLFYFRDTENA